MQMTWRWYGEGNDSVTLKQIKQIPGVEGVAQQGRRRSLGSGRNRRGKKATGTIWL